MLISTVYLSTEYECRYDNSLELKNPSLKPLPHEFEFEKPSKLIDLHLTLDLLDHLTSI